MLSVTYIPHSQSLRHSRSAKWGSPVPAFRRPARLPGTPPSSSGTKHKPGTESPDPVQYHRPASARGSGPALPGHPGY